jgi:hypothetical protein
VFSDVYLAAFVDHSDIQSISEVTTIFCAHRHESHTCPECGIAYNERERKECISHLSPQIEKFKDDAGPWIDWLADKAARGEEIGGLLVIRAGSSFLLGLRIGRLAEPGIAVLPQPVLMEQAIETERRLLELGIKSPISIFYALTQE